MKFILNIILSFVLVASAQAETVIATPIIRIPRVITTPGVYRLARDFNFNAAAGSAITIAASGVVIDLNGHALIGTAPALSTQAVGISCQSVNTVTIKNGRITGFFDGINLSGESRFVVENMTLYANVSSGITINGLLGIVRHNVVANTESASQNGGNNLPMFGIRVTGANARIVDNDVINTAPAVNGTGEADAITLQSGADSVIESNRVSNQANNANLSRGIYIIGSANVLSVNNRIINVQTGMQFDANSTGLYRDNIEQAVTTTYLGGTDVGNNH